MTINTPRRLFAVLVACTAGLASLASQAGDSLPSWNDGASKRAITNFVVATTTPSDAGYVPPAERIAVFDNDGTLWAEQPVYFQLAFALDRVKALTPQHPEWKEKEPFASLLRGDLKAALAGGEHAILEILMASHAGLTTDDFEAIVRQWLATARHPKTGRLYTGMVYQPMLELLAYLRANGYKTFIVSGGGVEFLRVFAEEVYGIPPEQVVGSSIRAKYEVHNGKPLITRLAEIDFINDKAGKPIGIQKFIGRRPVLAFGNSDGDFEMLEWTTTHSGPSLGLLVRHDDATREWAYDRESGIGRLARGLDEGPKRGWITVSMKKDWQEVYP
ncbi:MAG: haloacid dehalogenase-like hydrolase [Gammaproteobacteria bacterium]|nr:haloacid dehalogenase-like hydrolase [Gammaproteobacteria bacterium]